MPAWFLDMRDNNVQPTDVHPSEWAWIQPDKEFDKIMHNDGTLQELEKLVLDELTT